MFDRQGRQMGIGDIIGDQARQAEEWTQHCRMPPGRLRDPHGGSREPLFDLRPSGRKGDRALKDTRMGDNPYEGKQGVQGSPTGGPVCSCGSSHAWTLVCWESWAP
jgi:hypothetical protein